MEYNNQLFCYISLLSTYVMCLLCLFNDVKGFLLWFNSDSGIFYASYYVYWIFRQIKIYNHDNVNIVWDYI